MIKKNGKSNINKQEENKMNKTATLKVLKVKEERDFGITLLNS